MNVSRIGAAAAACCVATALALVTGDMLFPLSVQAEPADAPAEPSQMLSQPGERETAPGRDGGIGPRITDVGLLFERGEMPSCFALTGLVEFNETGISLLYRRAMDRRAHVGSEPVPGRGRIAIIEEDDCRIRLRVSFDDR